ncbi:MAG TPA: hypothetical protein VM452_02370 [Caulifigura sp.]|jgi:aspartokinase-like uncharacterized kinase|nr:hypothetical protein [Caulifigura sp.]
MSRDIAVPAVVVKLGGSLLELEDLAARLRGLFLMLEKYGGIATVVGGGPAADLVRRWDEQKTFSDREAHWMAIRAMRLTEMLVAVRVPECGSLEWERDEIREKLLYDQRVILSIEPMLEAAGDESPPCPPESWDVTSDTLSAWAAKHLGVSRLVLVKSVDAPAGGIAEAAERGLVDPVFERTAEGLEVSWVNLRGEEIRVVRLASRGG